MNREFLMCLLRDITQFADLNHISPPKALSPAVAGMQIFEAPLVGIAAASDPLFQQMKEPDIVGDHYLTPQEWLPGAQSVISFFLPFTRQVREGNRRSRDWPSEEWLHARIEGQVFVIDLCQRLVDVLQGEGYTGLIPVTDPRFSMSDKLPLFTSNWSERHAAYIAGLGTFALSRGLITTAGTAGRFGSVITTLQLEADQRSYTGVYDYCNRCGICAENCPVHAISLDAGKNQEICGAYLDRTAEKFHPRYGCGKCQVNVPCEMEIPV